MELWLIALAIGMGSTMNKPILVKEVQMGRQTFCLLKKSDYQKLAREAEGPYVDAIPFARASIGRGLRRDRLKAGLTQAEVARKAKIRVETLCRLESGRGNPTVATVRAICRALGQKV
jgi:DNA-binding XRE family transcriptional regulator